MTDLTTPEASVAAEWQCTQPWVWTMFEIALPMPPTGIAEHLGEVLDQGVDLGLVGEQELDVVAAGEPQMAVAVLVGEVGRTRGWSDASRRGEAARTVKSLSPDSPTCTITPGLRISWYFHLP